MVKETLQRTQFIYRTLTRRKLDALDLLETDHLKIEFLFLQWRMAVLLTRKEDLFEKIKKEILLHTFLEENFFYPACDKVPELKPLIKHSYQDHKKMKGLLREISALSLGTERAWTKMKALFKLVLDHNSVEENQVFELVRKSMKKAQFDKLSREIRIAKQQKDIELAA